MHRAEAIRFLRECYSELELQTDFSPENPIINANLSALVSNLSAWRSQSDLESLADCIELDVIAAGLQKICACAECAMEKWWCRRILADPCPAAQSLASFWYLKNTKRFARLNCASWKAASSAP